MHDYETGIEFRTSHPLTQGTAMAFWEHGTEFQTTGSRRYRFQMRIAADEVLTALVRIAQVANTVVAESGLSTPIDLLSATATRCAERSAQAERVEQDGAISGTESGQISSVEMARIAPNTAARIFLRAHTGGGDAWGAWCVLTEAFGQAGAWRLLTDAILAARIDQVTSRDEALRKAHTMVDEAKERAS
ncbi:hypothetical protein GCM10023196_036310 [Actinoallomurus vinaceus]|uniref:Uncharacterized protein n=1 Tax=Actinoallomurus vinaceus TaxID=1080074 RepID=A0ABP8U997_9ACTN